MLHDEFILRGPKIKSSLAQNFSAGKEMMERLKKRNPDDVFCVDGITDETITCGQLVNSVLKLVHILRGHGIGKGDVIGILSENCIKYPIVMVATFYLGAVANLISAVYSTEELKRALNMSKAKIVFCSKTALKNVVEVKNESDYIEKIILLEDPPNGGDSLDMDTLDSLLEGTSVDVNSVEGPPEINSREDLALIFLSSGTTGLPKCVMTTHANIRSTLMYFCLPEYLGIVPGHTTIALLPFFHIYGSSAIFCAAVYSLKLVVFPSFQPDLFLRCIDKYKVTYLYSVPSIVLFLAKHPLAMKANMQSVKSILSSGGVVGQELKEELAKRYPHIQFREMYGLTEATGGCTVSASFDPRKPGSIGTLVPDTEAMVWNTDRGENVEHLQEGELCFKNSGIMKGYIDREDNDIDGYGFYHTGDIGYYDEDGCFYIIGRIKELIKYKGYQVAPAEIENILLKHRAVKECSVIGIPDERAGELPAAMVVHQADSTVTEKELVDYVAERISIQKHLHGGVKFIDTIPRSTTGKILKLKLLELYKNISAS